MKSIEQLIQQKVSEALEGSFMDAQVYGVGFIRIQVEGNDISVEHVPFDEVDTELEKVVEQKKLMVRI
jgi:hypothetical protein